MELFVVNRYQEEDVPNQSEEILAQLHVQAEKRKRKIAKLNGGSAIDSEQQEEDTSINKKKKRRSSSQEHEANLHSFKGEIIEQMVDEARKSKKKKKKRNEIEEELNLTSESNKNLQKNLKEVSNEGSVVNESFQSTKKQLKVKKNEKNKKKKHKIIDEVHNGIEENSETEESINTSKKKLKARKEKGEGEKVNEVEETRKSKKKSKIQDIPNGIDKSLTVGKVKKKKSNKKNGDKNGEDEFTVIGKIREEKLEKVKRVLPDWLTRPSMMSSDLHNDLTSVTEVPDLHPSIVTLLEANGISHLFPVQAVVIPWMCESIRRNCLRPRDLCVSAPTGSGKTLAFVLPIVHALRDRIVRSIKALVVLPVIDLAKQVHSVFQTYAKGSGLQVGLSVGQNLFPAEQKTLVRKGYRRYHSLVDILVCTPGRLVDHINLTEGFSLKDLRFIVLDEADRTMQHIKQNWLQHVEQSILGGEGKSFSVPLIASRIGEMKHCPQKLLFSATLSQDPEKLAKLKLFQPKLFTSVINFDDMNKDEESRGSFIGKYTTPKELSEFHTVCDAELKPLILAHLIVHRKFRNVLCFTNKIESCHRLYLLLDAFEGITAREFSSKLHAWQRKEMLQEFKSGKVDVIICSDVMTRGMDIENVQCVVSYDIPFYLRTYVHRVGRTARAGRSGTAISLIEEHEELKFKKMMEGGEKLMPANLDVQQSDLEPMEEQYKTALKKVEEAVKVESALKRKKNTIRLKKIG